MRLNAVNQQILDFLTTRVRESYKVDFTNSIILETCPWLVITTPLHEEQPPIINLCEGVDGLPYISITHGKNVVHLEEENTTKGCVFYVTSPLDDFRFSLAGISTSKRGPIFELCKVWAYRGTAWGELPKSNSLGYCLYLAYQLSHEIKKIREEKKIYDKNRNRSNQV